MWTTWLAIIALSITISQCHNGQDQNIVKTITDQEINTNRVKRFITGYFAPQNKANLPRQSNFGNFSGYSQNTTQHYVNPVQNYNYSKPGYYPYNANPSTVKPVYPNPPGYNQYPGNYSGYPSPNLQPSNIPNPSASWTRPAQNNSTNYPGFNNKPVNPIYPGYFQYPANYSRYPAPQPQQSNIKPLYPTPPGYSQYTSNYSGYPAPQSNNKPLNPTQYPGNYSGYPASYPQQSNVNSLYPTLPGYSQNPGNYSGYPAQQNRPTPNAPWTRPAQNNTGYPVFNTTKPGYNNTVKYDKCRKEATGMDACVITAGYGCPEGMIRIGDTCLQDSDE
ncbi:adhesive plaque matrix protein-like [Spodoptera litura]|uniref:Adhesive plaque matrix protein-like n=1 Tax=Spodoptera litura TaxID=69820 RepID=A0A9J7ILX4_SPOLT|nr:adhesive plaque matrix protein-like [Spodoptera litura]